MAQSAKIDVSRDIERLLNSHGVSFASLVIDALRDPNYGSVARRTSLRLCSRPGSQNQLAWIRKTPPQLPSLCPLVFLTQIPNLKSLSPLHPIRPPPQRQTRFPKLPSLSTQSPSISIASLSDFTIADTSDDESPTDPTAVTPHDTFYLEDGNVEVLCGNTLFRVHKIGRAHV